MKFLIASDIHGSAYYTKKILSIMEEKNADNLVLLGDIYNHGPRNPFPIEYNPGEVATLLNSIKDKLIVIKGNCDSEVDKMISEFDFFENSIIVSGDKTVFLTHGHIYNKDSLPKTKFNAVIYGHFHTGFIEEKDETVVANSGSVSLPKNGTPSSYIILEDGVLSLFDIDGNLIKEKDL